MRSWIALFAVIYLLTGCSNSHNSRKTLTVFHAGSLSLPLKAAVDSFMKFNPEVTINLEASGSVECARKITDLNRPCDLFFSADYKVINSLLVTEHADFLIPFATNRMVIAYSSKSKYANIIDSLNWPTILLRSDVAYGRSDPNSDPCGYRTLLLFQLAEKHYCIDGLAESLEGKDNQFIRPKEVDLVAMLETSAIDYLFIYESVVKQHKLNYIPLPDSINLGNFSLAQHYGSVQVKIRGNSPNDSITIAGEPIVYAFTIPKNAPNPQLARKFATYFLSDTGGMKFITKMGQQSLIPFSCNSCGSVPDDFKEFIR
ncbi:extracellular solute-binding protein [Tenuifilum osseticum]|uniref:extracellular solute-binding protein n=1 Tax=Tenuifilum osseticum TaxID=3374723 RepID=UPI0034E49C77